eukprot:1578826-Ditylum_brightwellii.AAC.1
MVHHAIKFNSCNTNNKIISNNIRQMAIVLWFLELEGKFLPISIVTIVVIQVIVLTTVLRTKVQATQVEVEVPIISWLGYNLVRNLKLM